MIRKITLAILLINLIACTPTQQILYQRTGMVSCESHDRMTITLLSEGQAETLDKAVNFAERNAVENLLFKGIPKSNQEKPLIANEAKLKENNPDFLKLFIDNRGYHQFVTSSVVEEDYLNGNVHFIKQRMVFDLTNLRKHLQSQGITKKFGI